MMAAQTNYNHKLTRHWLVTTLKLAILNMARPDENYNKSNNLVNMLILVKLTFMMNIMNTFNQAWKLLIYDNVW